MATTENCRFNSAYDLSYDYDFASNRQSFADFEAELEIEHEELPLPWNQPNIESK